MSQIDLVYKLLEKDLTAPRVLLLQVVNYLRDQYEVGSADLPVFIRERYSSLEDYELDLIFSPQFTPAEHNRLDYIPVLADRALSPAELGLLKNRLSEARLSLSVRMADQELETELPLHEVFIERYVNLLKLDCKLPEGIYDEILRNVPEASRNEVNLLARSDAWKNGSRRDILAAFLRVFKANGSFTAPKVAFLTDFVKTYRPGSLLDIDRQLDALIESCKHDMENISGRGFVDENLKVIYAIDNEVNKAGKSDDHNWHYYEAMMDMAQQLKADAQTIPEAVPDLWERAAQMQPA